MATQIDLATQVRNKTPLANGGTNADLSASGSATAVLAQDAGHVVKARSLVSADIPNNAANTSGTAANLSGTPALPNGVSATTQPAGDNSTKLATTAYVDGKLLSVQFSSAGLTGNGAEQTLLTYTLPGGTMLAGRGVRVRFRWTTNSGNAQTFNFYFGATVIHSQAFNNAAQKFAQFEMDIFNQPGSATAQMTMAAFALNGATVNNTAMVDSAVDTTLNQVIKITFNAANTVTVSSIGMTVELL